MVFSRLMVALCIVLCLVLLFFYKPILSYGEMKELVRHVYRSEYMLRDVYDYTYPKLRHEEKINI